MTKPYLLLFAIVVCLAACDRRKDPQGSGQGVSSPPGQPVPDSGTEFEQPAADPADPESAPKDASEATPVAVGTSDPLYSSGQGEPAAERAGEDRSAQEQRDDATETEEKK